ncbi:MAG: hypothetical protein EHM70_23185 [Chloroflexota bacterium]|nr:MAG: hypothetical protein EHM70_23185 [Chloroflexota bacterium]
MPMVYKIKIKGELDKTWSLWLGNVDIRTEQTEDNGVITTLTVELIDQSALFGILDHIRDLNLLLVSVNQLGEDQETGIRGGSAIRGG